MLGDITAADEIFIVTGRTDMRKSIDGLCAIVEQQLHMDPRRSALYLFCGKRCDRIKALLWESDGFVLLYKRMEVQGRFRWPRNQLEVRQLTWQQIDNITDCVEYGEWKTGLRNDGFQYAFISLGNKVGMAIGTSVLAAALGACGYVSNASQNETVLAVIKHSFTTIPGALWIITAIVLFFYRLNRKSYNDIA